MEFVKCFFNLCVTQSLMYPSFIEACLLFTFYYWSYVAQSPSTSQVLTQSQVLPHTTDFFVCSFEADF